jgi:GTP-binding protein EngB required for normal cell division
VTAAEGSVSVPLDLTRSGPPALIIVGRTGAGKSTLINQIFGRPVAVTGSRPDVTQGIDVFTIPKTGLTIYDTPGAGGLDTDTETAMRTFLQLDKSASRRIKIPADVVLFLFSHDRVTRFDFEFFKEVDAVYRPRLLLVKNTKSDESESDRVRNTEAIESRTARRPLLVDALGGSGTSDVIREMLRMLPAARLLEFNRSLEVYRQKAHAMARAYATKYAAIAVVERGSVSSRVRSRVEHLRQAMYEDIARSYIDDIVISQRLGTSVTLVTEDTSAEATARTATGGIIGSLLGLIGGPIGVVVVGFLGALFGMGTTPRRVRGGSEAAVEMFAYARSISTVLDQAAAEPLLFFTRDPIQVNSWLVEHEPMISNSVSAARKLASSAIARYALAEFLNHPNTLDRADVEARLKPVADDLFL